MRKMRGMLLRIDLRYSRSMDPSSVKKSRKCHFFIKIPINRYFFHAKTKLELILRLISTQNAA